MSMFMKNFNCPKCGRPNWKIDSVYLPTPHECVVPLKKKEKEKKDGKCR